MLFAFDLFVLSSFFLPKSSLPNNYNLKKSRETRFNNSADGFEYKYIYV